MRVAIGVEYDGSPFTGWQSQAAGTGIQDVLEQAIARIAGAPVRVHAAGRTDAGVHATLQIVHFDVPAARPDTAWVRGVNAFLPAAVAVRWSVPVTDSFHARFSAQSRRYCYLLARGRTRPAVLAGKVGWVHHAVDLEAMRVAADHLVGTHDFTSFRSSECQARGPVRTLSRLEITDTGGMFRFDFVADAFLHHMVRNVVGALLLVGRRRKPAEWIGQVLAARDRTVAARTFSPAGLYLAGVEYDPGFALPEECRIPAFRIE